LRVLEVFRNLGRRKLRTLLTVAGIAVGIWALTVMGSLSEFMNSMVDVQIEQSKGQIEVSSAYQMGAPGLTPIPADLRAAVAATEGVDRVVPFVVSALGKPGGKPGGDATGALLGYPPEETPNVVRGIRLDSGQFLSAGETDTALAGNALARKYHLKVGQRVNFRGVDFRIKGIFKPYEAIWMNGSLVAPIDTVRTVSSLGPDAGNLVVYPKSGVDAETLATRLKKIDPAKLKVSSPKEAEKDARQTVAIFSAIVLAGAVLALVVGGFSTINTMVMAIAERSREIGLKKALGATDGSVLREYVLESGAVGLLGGAVGVVFGVLATAILNGIMRARLGLAIFSPTPRLVVFALVFAVALGAVAGIVPAWRAARLDPVRALRAE